MIISIYILVANAVAVHCLGYHCMRVNYFDIMNLVKAGAFELIFEVTGFVRIYAHRNREK